MMLRRLAVVGLILAGLAFCSPKASADTTLSVPFTGNVSKNCTFELESPGSLSLRGNILSSRSSGGAGEPALVNVSCNVASTVSVGDPIVGTLPPNAPQTRRAASAQIGSRTACSPGTSTVSVPPGSCTGSQNITNVREGKIVVHIAAEADNSLPIGDYSYDAPLMATSP